MATNSACVEDPSTENFKNFPDLNDPNPANFVDLWILMTRFKHALITLKIPWLPSKRKPQGFCETPLWFRSSTKLSSISLILVLPPTKLNLLLILMPWSWFLVWLSKSTYGLPVWYSHHKRGQPTPNKQQKRQTSTPAGTIRTTVLSLWKWRSKMWGPQKKPAVLSLACSWPDKPTRLFLSVLYRQTEQGRHFRWRGWMLRPRVFGHLQTRSGRGRGFEPHFAQRALFAFYFVVFLSFFFFVCLRLRQAVFVKFIKKLIRNTHPKKV